MGDGGCKQTWLSVTEAMVLVCALLHDRWSELFDKFSFSSFTLSWNFDGERWLFVNE